MNGGMDYILALHSHLPWVLHHGRWPHGSDWLCEAALDTYLPLLETLESLAADAVHAPVAIGFTPVLANQLRHPAFATEMEAFFEQRLAVAAEAPASLASTGDGALAPIAGFWRERLERLRRLYRRIDRDLIGAFRALEAGGRIEIIGSAATHGFLPLLARDESIRLQLALGVAEHRRLFGRAPAGCWLPECAYRPRGPWEPWPGAPRLGLRRGIDEHLADAGFRYFFIDAHLAAAGEPLNTYADRGATGAADEAADAGRRARRSANRAYRVAHGSSGEVAAFVRDARASAQVWSRAEGYPGDEWYLEFHKIRWPGGLKLWRVSAAGADLGAKAPYDPAHALGRAGVHAAHFADLLQTIAGAERLGRAGVIATPFDTELFGHWWFEGPDFIGSLYRQLARRDGVRPVTPTEHLRAAAPAPAIRLPQGSWGANGDFSMWLSDRTAWTWQRLWPLEAAFWDVAPAALENPAAHPVLAQAARELLLAQASDWQFIISTGEVTDYAERRLDAHCTEAERLVAALQPGAAGGLEAGYRLAEESGRRDDLFPEIIPAIAAAVSGSRAIAVY